MKTVSAFSSESKCEVRRAFGLWKEDRSTVDGAQKSRSISRIYKNARMR
jgi:hypothetical protein